MRVVPQSPPGKIAAVLVILAVLWVGFILSVAGSGRAICVGEMMIASQQALIRQGVWNHILSEEAGDRALAHPGVPQPGFNPTDEIDQRRVDAFLASHPDCCRVYPYGAQGGFQYVLSRLFAPWRMSVDVRDPREGVVRRTSYEVDACSSNVRKMS